MDTNDAPLASPEGLCFALNERESPVIRRTSGATLAQLVHQLFENANNEATNDEGKLEGNEGGSASKLTKRTADAISLATAIFEEFCLIASGKPGNQLALLRMGAHSSSLFGSRVPSAAGGSADEVSCAHRETDCDFFGERENVERRRRTTTNTHTL